VEIEFKFGLVDDGLRLLMHDDGLQHQLAGRRGAADHLPVALLLVED